MKRILIFAMVAILGLGLAGCQGAIGDENAESYARQLRVMANHVALWKLEDDFGLWGYAVTDLDDNGRLEVISSQCQGTGLYTSSNFWEVNETFDGLTLCNTEGIEGDSEVDIMTPTVPVYCDSNRGVRYFIFDDLIKNGAAEYYENRRALTLQGGNVSEINLAYKSTIYSDADNAVVTCTDAEGETISEEEYDAIADRYFSGLDQRQANIGWMTEDSAQVLSMDEDEIYHMLESSFQGFQVK